MKTSESIQAISKALVDFKKKVENPKKSGVNNHFKSKYATLDDIDGVIKKTAPTLGLTYIQSLVTDENGTGCITTLLHESGEFIECPPFYAGAVGATRPHEIGSSVTYARRYSLAAAFALTSDEDDDGNAASLKTEPLITEAQLAEIEQSLMLLGTPDESKQKFLEGFKVEGWHELTKKQAAGFIVKLNKAILDKQGKDVEF